jgi:hypothetical protein
MIINQNDTPISTWTSPCSPLTSGLGHSYHTSWGELANRFQRQGSLLFRFGQWSHSTNHSHLITSTACILTLSIRLKSIINLKRSIIRAESYLRLQSTPVEPLQARSAIVRHFLPQRIASLRLLRLIVMSCRRLIETHPSVPIRRPVFPLRSQYDPVGFVVREIHQLFVLNVQWAQRFLLSRCTRARTRPSISRRLPAMTPFRAAVSQSIKTTTRSHMRRQNHRALLY